MARTWTGSRKGKGDEPDKRKAKGKDKDEPKKKETGKHADKSGGVGLSEGSSMDEQGRNKVATHQAYSVNERGIAHSHVSCWCNATADHPK